MSGTDTPLSLEGGATNLQQKLFEERVNELVSWKKRFRREVMTRRVLAYLLKSISIFGAIIVAAKIEWIDQTVLGLVIAAAVGLDQLTSNHARLLAIAAARYACERLYANIVAKHSTRLPSILSLRDKRQETEARRQLENLLSELMLDLHKGQEKILVAVQEADLKALNSLYVDTNK